MSGRRLGFAGGFFERAHRRRIGPAVDLSGLDAAAIPASILERARFTWAARAASEFRSIQIMARFLTEVVGAGDPLDVYAGALELVEDEIRHAEMCASVCAALGAPALLPDPTALVESEAFLAAPMPERALASAITMLAINETISVGYVADLVRRCRHPVIKQVLDATAGDEADHQAFGWTYIRESMRRFPPSAMKDWQHLVKVTLEPHEAFAAHALRPVPRDRQHLEAWPESELADLGLLSPERQALVFRRTRTQDLDPRLAELGLAPHV